jgi:hypothetical protein
LYVHVAAKGNCSRTKLPSLSLRQKFMKLFREEKLEEEILGVSAGRRSL